ncbi:MAG TPA: hypothetical protein VEU74_13005 [Gemmatimonadales bacterium]|nr:hypothetical protein [Gemmatimonadales bacterium]
MAVTPQAQVLLKVGTLFEVLALAWPVFRHVPARELLPGLRGSGLGPLACLAIYAVPSALNFSGLVLTGAGRALFGFWSGRSSVAQPRPPEQEGGIWHLQRAGCRSTLIC